MHRPSCEFSVQFAITAVKIWSNLTDLSSWRTSSS